MKPRPTSRPTVLIVGGTGRLGRMLVPHFRHLGWNVRVLTRNLARAERSFRDQKEVSFVEADLSEPSTLIDAPSGCLLTIFAAGACRPAYAADSAARLDFQQINVEALRVIGQANLRAGNPPLIHLSSFFVIGLQQTGIITESTEPCPLTPFGRSERDGELALLDLHRHFDLDCRIVRLPPVVGAAPRGGLLDGLHVAAMESDWAVELNKFAGTSKPLIAPADFVSAVEAARQRGAAGQVYQVSSGDFDLSEIAASLRALAIAHPSLREYGLSHSKRPKALDAFLREYLRWDVRVVTDRARAELGWEPAVTRIQDFLLGSWFGDGLDSVSRRFRGASLGEATP
jgi:nucleoside-diphosphate-sugar epimerase